MEWKMNSLCEWIVGIVIIFGGLIIFFMLYGQWLERHKFYKDAKIMTFVARVTVIIAVILFIVIIAAHFVGIKEG